MNRPVPQFYVRQDGLAGIDKVPTEVEVYSLDWTPELAPGQSIVSATWSVPAGLTNGGEGIASPRTTVRLSGGVAGTEYTVTCTAVKTGGLLTVPRAFVVRVVAAMS